MSQITDEEKVALKEYAGLKVEIRASTKRLEDLKPLVEEVLTRVDAEKNPIETEGGKFTLRPRRLWTYTEELEQRMAYVKSDQKVQQATGEASFEERRDVYFS